MDLLNKVDDEEYEKEKAEAERKREAIKKRLADTEEQGIAIQRGTNS
jgi:hypothetical protein